MAAYSEPWRHYHHVQHLSECLAALDEAKATKRLPHADAIEMALWFHDAVYDPKAGDNEERSAQMAQQALEAAHLAPAFITDVVRLVMCTKTHNADGHADAQWMIDIDLSILGREPQRFQEYEVQIRAEYSWVPAEVYAEKRAEILTSFLNRDQIFSTESFREKLEGLARWNLAALIESLRRPDT